MPVTHVADVRLITRQNTARSVGKVASSPKTGCLIAGRRKNCYRGDSEYIKDVRSVCLGYT